MFNIFPKHGQNFMKKYKQSILDKHKSSNTLSFDKRLILRGHISIEKESLFLFLKLNFVSTQK